jgi:hypothetical protein
MNSKAPGAYRAFEVSTMLMYNYLRTASQLLLTAGPPGVCQSVITNNHKTYPSSLTNTDSRVTASMPLSLSIPPLKSHPAAWTPGSRRLFVPSPLHADNDHIKHSNNACHHGIGDLATHRIPCELQAQAAVDGSTKDEDSAEPDVGVGDGAAATGFEVQRVAKEAAEGLDEKENNEKSAEDGVGAAGTLVELY